MAGHWLIVNGGSGPVYSGISRQNRNLAQAADLSGGFGSAVVDRVIPLSDPVSDTNSKRLSFL